MRINYAILAFIILMIEIAIALWVNDSFIRPYVGDFLVTILIYCCVMIIKKFTWKVSLCFTIVFCYLVEVAQYFNVVNLLGLENNHLARVVIGTHFSWGDLLCYALAAISIYIVEHYFTKAN